VQLVVVLLVAYSLFFLLVGKRFSSHVPIYAFRGKRKGIFNKKAKGLENQALAAHENDFNELF
jgi:hypothetical protein